MLPSRSIDRLARLPLVLMMALSGCGGGRTPEVTTSMASETFIATYVDLRATALSSGESLISDDERSEVLARHGVTEEDLTRFLETHGEDVELMRDVWDEVERRLDVQRLAPDSGDAASLR
jgi:hypothetical protein